MKSAFLRWQLVAFLIALPSFGWVVWIKAYKVPGMLPGVCLLVFVFASLLYLLEIVLTERMPEAVSRIRQGYRYMAIASLIVPLGAAIAFPGGISGGIFFFEVLGIGSNDWGDLMLLAVWQGVYLNLLALLIAWCVSLLGRVKRRRHQRRIYGEW